MNKKLIYVVDDEINICNIIKSFLVKAAFEVEIFNNGFSMFQAFTLNQADMVVIDIMMPEMDGYTLCSLIRANSSVPIIMVSAKDRPADKIEGLTLGGDDYLTKPFSPLELIARVNSIFRRIELDKGPINNNRIVKISDVFINLDTKQVEVNNKVVGFTPMEISLLYYLIKNKNRAVSRSELLDKVWGFEDQVETRATDDMIKRIRKKLSETGSILRIDTVWGFGFTIQDKEGCYEKEYDKMEGF